ncbi:conserved Plasmodium protein, unknown function [Plasmodium sp. gorilla clade G2]|uniref:conserved Plasmodium protein, unknown function n=1 Tax=Plasmodium sp. gorilla clade G2 TaxID=880535 RepID=UPI000D229354|nr:conserved Plasmodium protein, unknown function [Plasmodium sp. gorilla clade G2]SOV11642.1 conserved Plasmodium protein, unknown function [Plasmodium sp. gorilla clade G2]
MMNYLIDYYYKNLGKYWNYYITFIISYGRYKFDRGKNGFIEEFIDYNNIEEIDNQTIQSNEENSLFVETKIY